jgi:hypothetical protein
MAVAGKPDLTQAELRRELRAEREQLAEAVEALRRATDYETVLRARIPLLALAAFGGAFVLSGGIGAAVRLVLRRRREGHVLARFERYALVDHR